MVFEEFKNKFENKEVVQFPEKVKNKPLVSVCVVTYQHVNYIKESLDSILNQKADFDIEILIGDDNSTDGTREICIEYAEQYPDKIRLFLHHRENNIKIGGQPTGRFNFLYNLFSAKGKYIALCEGDDYWTDPLKLQKQVDFLEANEDCVLCHHWQKLGIVKNGRFQEVEAPKEEHGYYPLKKADISKVFSNQLRVKTRTVLFRSVINPGDLLTVFPNAAFGDVPLSFLLGKKGKFGFMDEEMAVYRVTESGVSTVGLKELGVREFATKHSKDWIYVWDCANKLCNYQYANLAHNTIKNFFRRMPMSPKELLDVLQFNFKRKKAKLSNKLNIAVWLIYYNTTKFLLRQLKK